MAGLKKDNLSDSLIEYLEGLGLSEEQVQQLIDNTSGDLSALQTTDKSSLVAAINELFQSANNGKELIATAIGEPLNSSDTFSAMSNGINNLNSQFKSALMNNGVAVESNDKFKQLIEKLALLSNSEGKGIKFASGNLDNFGFSKNYQTLNFEAAIGFIPTYMFIHFGIINNQYSGSKHYNIAISNIETSVSKISQIINTKLTITNLSENGFSILGSQGASNETMYSPSFSNITWYAIGVGEEDTTLEDSLRSILTSKGVSVTEEDNLASLISKVDLIPLAQGNAVEANVLSGKTFTNADGTLRTGTMANRGGAQTVTPGTSNKTLNSGYYSGNITVKGDSNLVAANIVSGKSIFGVNGSAPKAKTVTASDDVLFILGPSSQYSYGSGISFKSDTWLSVGTVTSPGTGTVKVETKYATHNSSYPAMVLFVQTRNGTEIARSEEFETSTPFNTISSYDKYPVVSHIFTVQQGDVIQLFTKAKKSGTNSNNSTSIFYFKLGGTLS